MPSVPQLIPAMLGGVTISLLQEPQGSERVNDLNKCSQLASDKDGLHQGLSDPGARQFLCSMALGRKRSHHTPSHSDEQRSTNPQNQSIKSGRSWRK